MFHGSFRVNMIFGAVQDDLFTRRTRNLIVGGLMMPFGGASILAFLDFITTQYPPSQAIYQKKGTAMATGNAPWSNNNLACINTWAFLRVLKQLRAIFKNAGDLKMSALRFWNSVASNDARRLEAEAVASQLDRMFVLGLRATYETGQNHTSAVTSMAATLSLANKTVRELAATVDDAYNFVGEKM